MTRIFLCLDLGGVRIGTAIGSIDTRLSKPLDVIYHKSRVEDIEKIQKLIKSLNVTDLIIGMSFQEDGKPNSMGRHAQVFGSLLEKETGVPVTYWDESLSTRDAHQLGLDSGVPKFKRRGHQDSLAAALILQSFMDNFSSNESCSSK